MTNDQPNLLRVFRSRIIISKVVSTTGNDALVCPVAFNDAVLVLGFNALVFRRPPDGVLAREVLGVLEAEFKSVGSAMTVLVSSLRCSGVP